MIRIYLLVAVTMLIAAAAGAQDHGYTPADIENGGRLYQASCGGCHAQDGAGVVRHRAGARAVSSWHIRHRPDQDHPDGYSRHGDAAAQLHGCPGRHRGRLPPKHGHGSQRGGAHGASRHWRRGARQGALRGQRAVHDLPSRQRKRAAAGAGPERGRRDAAAARAASGAARSERHDARRAIVSSRS